MLFTVVGTKADLHTELRGDANCQPCCNGATSTQPEPMEFQNVARLMHCMKGPINYPAA